MANRQQSMATIDAALQQPDPAAAQAPSAGITASMPMLPFEEQTQQVARASLTSGEKRAIDVQRQKELDAKAEAKQLSLEEAEELRQQRELDEQQRSDFEKSARATLAGAKQTINSVKVQAGRLPTPGSLAFPLIILGIFFLLLIPINGHTRLTWLWLTLTGNAEIQASGANTSTATNTEPVTAGSTIPYIVPSGSQTQAPVITLPYSPGSNGTGNASGTYAEDV